MTRRHQRVDTGGRHQAAATPSKRASMLVDARGRAQVRVTPAAARVHAVEEVLAHLPVWQRVAARVLVQLRQVVELELELGRPAERPPGALFPLCDRDAEDLSLSRDARALPEKAVRGLLMNDETPRITC